MNKKRSFLSGMLVGVMLTLVVGGGYFAGRQLYRAFSGELSTSFVFTGEGQSVANPETINKMNILEELVTANYLRDVEKEEMQEGVYRGMIAALDDPYSQYYSKEEQEELQKKTQGIYYGIGASVTIDQETNLPRIAKVFEGTPAQEAGILANDLLYMVDDTLVQGMDLLSAVSLVKGDEGTTVHLTVIREGETDYLEFDVERRKLENETVEYRMLDEEIGYIQITEFDNVTVDQFTDALATCKGSGMKGLILDLRGNPGGNLSTVCDIARMMLPEGLIVYTEDKEGKRVEYSCDGEHPLEAELVVLVDGNSASASEILAGAVKDYGIGTLVGTTTYGKGVVQHILKISDGSAVKLTASKYYTPKGNDIHEVGIAPDVEVSFDGEAYLEDGTDNQLEEAISIMKEKIK